MENPKSSIRAQNRSLALRQVVPEDVAARRGNDAIDEPTRAGGPGVLAMMNQHIEFKGRGHRLKPITDAPSIRVTAAFAARRTSFYNASRHGMISTANC